jgi:hypothetical protein
VLLEKEDITAGDVFIAHPSLVGVYCFLCHPNSTFDLIKDAIYSIKPGSVCVYTGEYWEGLWDWSFSNKRIMLFIKIIYEGKIFWTNIDWLQKLI